MVQETFFIQEGDKCFENYPISYHGIYNGVSTIGRELWTGIICQFLVVYNHGSRPMAAGASECTIKSKPFGVPFYMSTVSFYIGSVYIACRS